MWWFSKAIDYSVLHTDIHSHLIPGIDDGAKSMGDAIRMIRKMRSLGFKRLITTPHVYSAMYPNTRHDILEGYFALREAMNDLEINDIELGIAAEYMVEPSLIQLIERQELLTLPGNFVLVETSPFDQPYNLIDCIFKLKLHKYNPLIAHPERYHFIQDDMEQATFLKQQGCALQVNLLSLTGYYGKRVKDCAVALVKKGYVDFLGSDTHKDKHLDLLDKARKNRKFKKLFNNINPQNHILQKTNVDENVYNKELN